MSKLVTINTINDEKVLDEIFSNEILVFEDIQGSKILINWDGEKITIKPKTISNDPINMIDLAMQNYYNLAFNFFENLNWRVKSLLNKRWWFCFEYFPDNQPANIEYNKVPKNNLVLTSIYKGHKFECSIDELDEYARLLEVDVIPLIFKGKLNEETKQKIKYFLSTSEKDLDFVFGEKSFAYFFFKILNPQLQNSFLMEEDFQKNLEKIIIRLDTKDVSFEILNPLYKRMSESNNTDFVEIYTLILINFLNFCQSQDLSKINPKMGKKDEIYINFICQLFNIYISETGEDLKKFDIVIPDFFDKDKFRINKNLIPNELTLDIINYDKKFEYIFKIIIGSFNRKKRKPIGLFTDSTVQIFNKFVDEIQMKIDNLFKKKTELELTKSGLLDFGDYLEIKYDVDSQGQIYPDVYTEIENAKSDGKKKDKKFKYYQKK